MPLDIRPKETCTWDCVALGEVMLRLDPGDFRVRTARSFAAYEGGGEYNVVRGLRKCFGLRTAVVTANVDNEIGHLVEELMMAGGVDQRHVKWLPFDGIGRKARVPLNFTERGFGVRAAKGTSDRAHSAAGTLKPGDVNWKRIFQDEGARWFHTGGIFAAISETTPDVVIEAMTAARAAGTVISYDLNYRPSLWKDVGGEKRAQEVNRQIAGMVDVMIGNEEDFTACLGLEVHGTDAGLTKLDPSAFKAMITEAVKQYPNFKAVATTLRAATTASFNDWGAVLYADGAFFEATQRPGLQILDRVGGGDSFASGLIFGFLAGERPEACVNLGAAHGALAMTTPGDTSMMTEAEVRKAAAGGGARVDR
ncbi:MAG: PfkB family carbohydrate kinase [Phycisphaerae bacterium]